VSSLHNTTNIENPLSNRDFGLIFSGVTYWLEALGQIT